LVKKPRFPVTGSLTPNFILVQLTPGLQDEVFFALGGTPENPEPGEVTCFDDKTRNIMCRRWNWRNGDITKITRNTKKIVINMDPKDFCRS